MAYVWVLSGNLRSFWRNYQRGGFAFLSVTAAELHAPVHVKSPWIHAPSAQFRAADIDHIWCQSRGAARGPTVAWHSKVLNLRSGAIYQASGSASRCRALGAFAP